MGWITMHIMPQGNYDILKTNIFFNDKKKNFVF